MSKSTKTKNRQPARRKPTALTRSVEAKSKSAQPSRTTPVRDSKISSLIGLLQRKDGATIEQMIAATGWQAHSIRGAISGSLRKKLKLKVTSAKVDGVRTYRIAR